MLTLQHPKDTVLIVDDKVENTTILLEFLSSQGYQTLVAEEGQTALLLAEKEKPQLILLDIMMPGMDGFETCQYLRENPVTQHIPVVFMTALTDTQNKIRGFKHGGIDYITKPFQQEEVLARIHTHLTISKLQKELHTQKTALTEANYALSQLSSTDELTQVANRSRLEEHLNLEWPRAVREQTCLSIILCEIDYFKEYKEHRGHKAGDRCLFRVAQLINQAAKRPADLVGRYDREIFMIILPNTPIHGATHVGETIQHNLAQTKLSHGQSPISPYITISLGVVSTVPSYQSSPAILLQMGDKLLYDAKQAGCNTLIHHRV